jgi:hypothetical protein
VGLDSRQAAQLLKLKTAGNTVRGSTKIEEERGVVGGCMERTNDCPKEIDAVLNKDGGSKVELGHAYHCSFFC